MSRFLDALLRASLEKYLLQSWPPYESLTFGISRICCFSVTKCRSLSENPFDSQEILGLTIVPKLKGCRFRLEQTRNTFLGVAFR